MIQNVVKDGLSGSTTIAQTPYGEVDVSESTFTAGTGKYVLQFSGTQKIRIADTRFEGNAGAIFFNGHMGSKTDATNASKITLTNVSFVKNSAAQSGGAVYAYGNADVYMKGGRFSGNSVTAQKSQAHGGAIVVKSGTWTFENVAFNDNVAKATGDGGFATGGAILVDMTTGIKIDGKNALGKVIFDVSKNMTYSGNRVETESTDPGNTYGWYAYTSGGFLFLDRYAEGEFKIADGSTLTIGLEQSKGEDDSIASALPDSNTQNPAYSTLRKTGAGTVKQNSSMDNYYGIFKVEEGTWSMAKAWKSRAHTTVTGGTLRLENGITLDNLKSTKENSNYFQAGALAVAGGTVETTTLTIKNSAEATEPTDKPSVTLSAGNLVVTGALKVEDGALNMTGGTLTTGIGNVFAKGTVDGSLAGVDSLKTGLSVTGGTLSFTDEGEYEYSLLTQMAAAVKNDAVGYKFGNAVLKVDAEKDVQDGKLDVQAKTETGSLNVGDPAVEVHVNADLTLTGDRAGSAGVQKLVGEAAGVTVKGQNTFTAGSADSGVVAAELPKVTLDGTASRFNVLGIDLSVSELAGTGTTAVGSDQTAGRLAVGELSGSGVIFVDPAWSSDPAVLDTIGQASHLEISELKDGKLQAAVIGGQNSLMGTSKYS